MKILILLLFPICSFAQLPAGKYLKVKDDATGFELVTLSAVPPTRLADSAASLRTWINSNYAFSNHNHTYSNLNGLPTLFDGNYNSLTNKPSLFTQATADGLYSTLSHNHNGVYQPVGSYLVAADIANKLNTNGNGSALTGITAAQIGLRNNRSVVLQTPFSTDTYLTGSAVSLTTAPVVGTTYKLTFDVTKTAAGTATPVITVRIGTNGTVADAAINTFTFGAGTAAADAGIFEVVVVFRTVGAGTSAVTQSWCKLVNNLTTTGLSNGVKVRVSTSGGFNSTTANLIIGVSYNGGASAAHTVQLVRAELIQ